MTDFIRPALNAVTSAEELTVGTKLYHVFGIWPPFMAADGYTVTRAPIAFKDHPACPEHYSLSESVVFDTERGEMHFASDGNIGAHHNNNYWFKSKEDAEIYCAQCREDWESHPEEIKLVQERRLQAAYDDLYLTRNHA